MPGWYQTSKALQFKAIGEFATNRTYVMVQGSLRSRDYESDGVQRRIFELRADTVAKLDRAERREEESTPSDI